MFSKPLAILVVLALAAGGYYFWQQNNRQTQELTAVETVTEAPKAEQDQGSGFTLLETALGDENAPITIVEYASFTCPHCARFHTDVFGKIVKNYVEPGNVRFVMRDVYFDKLGLWAAMLARCDGGNRFFGISDIIFRTQHEWTSGENNLDIIQNLQKIGKIAGLDQDTMDACLQDNDMAQTLATAYQKNSERDDVRGTPTFLINGIKYPNMSYADFSKTLDGLLAE